MRRVLVAQSVGLWIRLNRHLSGIGAVDLVETPTLESGLLLTQLERPAVVVLGREAGAEEAERLIESLDRNECHGTRVVLACPDLEPTPRPVAVEDRSLVVCGEEDVVPVVTELLALSEEPERNLNLLVHYRAEPEEGVCEGFVVVLDVDGKSLLLQADNAFALGLDLTLDFFLPAAAPGAHRKKASLCCTIDGSPDEADLIYHARISTIEAWAAAALERLRGGMTE